MDSKQLIYFKKVAELEHMTKAAEELYVSQTHLSRTIASLERELGAPLFDREGRGIRLNDAGKLFYKHALKIIRCYSEACSQVKEMQLRQGLEFFMGTNAGAYMPGFLAYFSRLVPNARLCQYSAPRSSLSSMLRSGRIDFVIAGPPMKDMETDCMKIFTETPVLICPENHWMRGRKTISIHELEGENMVGVPIGYGARDSMEECYREYGVSPKFVMETSDSRSVEDYVSAGLGIAVVPRFLIRESACFSSSYIEFEEDLSCPAAISWRKGEQWDERKQSLFDAALDYFKRIEQ